MLPWHKEIINQIDLLNIISTKSVSFVLDFIIKYKIANVAPNMRIKTINKIVSMIRKLYYKGKLIWDKKIIIITLNRRNS